MDRQTNEIESLNLTDRSKLINHEQHDVLEFNSQGNPYKTNQSTPDLNLMRTLRWVVKISVTATENN